MKRFHKVLVALSVVAAVSAISVPASAVPSDDQQCIELDLTKYGWGSTNICI